MTINYTVTPCIDKKFHYIMTLIPNWTLLPTLTLLLNFERFQYNICIGCEKPTEDAYSYGHLVLSNLGPLFVPMLWSFSPEIIFFRTLISVLLFCLKTLLFRWVHRFRIWYKKYRSYVCVGCFELSSVIFTNSSIVVYRNGKPKLWWNMIDG